MSHRGPQRDAHDRVYSTVHLHTPGVVRTIATYAGRLKITTSRDGVAAGGSTFRGAEELQVLSRAAELAMTAPRTVNAGFVRLPSGSTLEVGGGDDVVVFRTILPSGERRRTTFIGGAELGALRLALRDLTNEGETYEKHCSGE